MKHTPTAVNCTESAQPRRIQIESPNLLSACRVQLDIIGAIRRYLYVLYHRYFRLHGVEHFKKYNKNKTKEMKLIPF